MAPLNQVLKKGLGSAAAGFLELASEQRLEILSRIYGQNLRISSVAKDIDATVPEVFRNFERLAKSGLIVKETDGSYSISAAGRLMCNQISLVGFLEENKAYLKGHSFPDVPEKFLQRIGQLEAGKQVRGFVKVLEKWKTIYENARSYINNILFEVPYTADFIEPIAKKAAAGVRVHSVFSSNAIVPSDRKKIFEKHGFRRLVEKGLVERRMLEDVKTVVILNESEALVMFPSSNGKPDLSEGFYSNHKEFHEWCLDYFAGCWQEAKPFSESKILDGA